MSASLVTFDPSQKLSLSFRPPGLIDTEGMLELTSFFAAAYGEAWVGSEQFLTSTISNTTHVVRGFYQDTLVCALCINVNRVISIAAAAHFTNRGELLQEFLKMWLSTRHISPAWITVDAKATPLIAILLREGIGFTPLEKPEVIEHLFIEIRGTGLLDTRMYKDVPTDPELKRATGRDEVTLITRSHAFHDPSYEQIVLAWYP